MAVEIRRTPTLSGKSLERFNRILRENETRKVGPTPTPGLRKATAAIMRYQESQRRKRGEL